MKSEKDILAVLGREIHNASGFIGGELVSRRKKIITVLFRYAFRERTRRSFSGNI